METAVIIPVPEAAPAVARHRWTHDPTSAVGIPEHITLLGPFVAVDVSVEQELISVFAAAPAFTFQLTHAAWFRNEVLYLAPEPSAPFIALTHRLVDRFGVKPYGGEYADVVPHLTVAQENATPELEARLLPALPIDAQAVEAWLMVQPVAEGGWIRHLRLPFSGTV